MCGGDHGLLTLCPQGQIILLAVGPHLGKAQEGDVAKGDLSQIDLE